MWLSWWVGMKMGIGLLRMNGELLGEWKAMLLSIKTKHVACWMFKSIKTGTSFLDTSLNWLLLMDGMETLSQFSKESRNLSISDKLSTLAILLSFLSTSLTTKLPPFLSIMLMLPVLLLASKSRMPMVTLYGKMLLEQLGPMVKFCMNSVHLEAALSSIWQVTLCLLLQKQEGNILVLTMRFLPSTLLENQSLSEITLTLEQHLAPLTSILLKGKQLMLCVWCLQAQAVVLTLLMFSVLVVPVCSLMDQLPPHLSQDSQSALSLSQLHLLQVDSLQQLHLEKQIKKQRQRWINVKDQHQNILLLLSYCQCYWECSSFQRLACWEKGSHLETRKSKEFQLSPQPNHLSILNDSSDLFI